MYLLLYLDTMKFTIVFLLILLGYQNGCSQEGFVFKEGVTKEKIAFREHSNLIVIPVKINNVEFNFILDTGANKTIIFNLKGIDSLSLREGGYIKVKGYGDKEFLKAYQSKGNTIEIGDHIHNKNAEVLVLSDKEIDLSSKVDVEVHGLLGIDFFKNFVIHLDYRKSYVRAYSNYEDLPRSLRKKKQFDLKVKNGRPLVQIKLENDLLNGAYDFLIDTGSGDALWVFNEIDETFTMDNSFEDYLGFGINGKIYGLRTKVNSIDLFDTSLQKVSVSYPYKKYHNVERTSVSNDGSLGGEILRRYDVIIDYPNKKIAMKPNRFFKDGFYYNMSGLGIQRGETQLFTEIGRDFSQDKDDFGNITARKVTVSNTLEISYKYVPKIFIDYVRENSPGDKVGIEVGDQIISINGYKQRQLTLHRVSQLFYKNPYKNLRIKLKRGDEEFKVKFKNIPLIL